MDESDHQGQDNPARMNEAEFKEQWELDKPAHKAWGDYVVDTISQRLQTQEKNLNDFLKVPAKSRLKDDRSLIDKAFYRGKDYSDPYNEIEDKVGARFIVLLQEELQIICDIIESNNDWQFDACKHYETDRELDPLLFTYQSVHYILRPKREIAVEGISIPISTPCEVQIRTLLQHAHAELTHDAIYKSERTVQPKVHRTVAKCMALIETTDDFFSEATRQLNHGPLEEYGIQARLDGLYRSMTGLQSYSLKSSIVIWDQFEQLIDDQLVDNIQSELSKIDSLPEIIKSRYGDSALYQQSIVLFIYWMLKKKKRRLLKDWPFSRDMLEPLANDLGISILDG